MKLLGSLFLCVWAVAGQGTAPDVTRQSRAPVDLTNAARVQIARSDGSVTLAIFGPGVEADFTGPIPMLRLTQTTVVFPAEVRIEVVANSIPQQFYDLQHDNIPAAGVKVFKNGLLQMRGPQFDYQFSGRRVTFNAGSVLRAEVTQGDYIQILYFPPATVLSSAPVVAPTPNR